MKSKESNFWSYSSLKIAQRFSPLLRQWAASWETISITSKYLARERWREWWWSRSVLFNNSQTESEDAVCVEWCPQALHAHVLYISIHLPRPNVIGTQKLPAQQRNPEQDRTARSLVTDESESRPVARFRMNWSSSRTLANSRVFHMLSPCAPWPRCLA